MKFKSLTSVLKSSEFLRKLKTVLKPALLTVTSIYFLSSTAFAEPKVIEFKQLNLQGTVQRPSASFFMGRRKLKFKGLVPKKSFIKEIKESVKKPPF